MARNNANKKKAPTTSEIGTKTWPENSRMHCAELCLSEPRNYTLFAACAFWRRQLSFHPPIPIHALTPPERKPVDGFPPWTWSIGLVQVIPALSWASHSVLKRIVTDIPTHPCCHAIPPFAILRPGKSTLAFSEQRFTCACAISLGTVPNLCEACPFSSLEGASTACAAVVGDGPGEEATACP